jgi:multidrug efflux pump subunit AcrA (membrane-fusion protein)
VDFEKTRTLQPLEANKKQLEVEKQRHDLQKLQDQLRRLEVDRSAMPIVAPVDGWLVYGATRRGQWPDTDKARLALRPRLKLAPHVILMTIVPTAPVLARMDVPESLLEAVRPATRVKVVPTGFPDLELTGVVDHVSELPLRPDTFDGLVRLEQDSIAANKVKPGMSAKIIVTLCDKEATLTIPTAALKQSELDPDEEYVLVLGDDSASHKRVVTPGKRTEKRVEILEGLEPGERIVTP